MSYLAHASDPRHNGVVKEVKFLSRLAKEEVNLVVVTNRVSYWLTLLDVSRPNKDWIWFKKKKKEQMKETHHAITQTHRAIVKEMETFFYSAV